MPQSPAAAIVWFQTAKNKNTKQNNQKTNMNKPAFCGVEFIVCTDIWGLYSLTPQRYLTHERLSHNLYRGLLHLRDRRNLLPFWDVVGASIKSIPTKYHTLGTTFTGCKSIIAAGVSRKRSRVALFEDPRFLFLGEQFVEALCHPSPWQPRTRTLILSHTRTFWQISQSRFFAL